MKQKLLNSIKLRATLLVAMLCAVSTGAWADDPTVTLTQSALELTGTYTTGTEKTISGITFVYTDLMKNNYNIQAKASSGEIYNKTAFPRNIKSVAITHSGTARATTIFGSSDGTNWTQISTGSGSITADFTSKSYKYFKITRGSNAAYWTQIVITYEAAPSFTLSAESNNTTYGTVSVEDNVITASPAEGCRVSKTTPYEVTSGESYVTNVAQSGNVFTVTATGDCAFRINFEASPTCTITYSENGVTRNVTVLEGAAIDFSAPGSIPSGYAFVGWATETISGTQATAPTFVTEASASGNATYYAVYAEAVDSDVSATFAANNITNTPAVSGETNTWRDNSTGITLKLSDGQRYTSGTPNTFTVTKGTSNYFEITTSGTLTSVVTTVSGTDYVIGSVSTGTLATDDTEQTVNSFSSASSVKCYATSSYQIRATTIVVNAVQTVLENYCTTISSKPKAVITLSASDIAMVWGDTDKVLTATLTVGGESSAEALTFTSSSSDLTRASNGTLSCDEPGDYTITVSIDETETHQAAVAVCNVTVTKKAVTLSFAETAVDGLLGQAFTAPLLTNDDNAPVSYTSGTPETATVDDGTGEVTLVAKGTTVITANATGKYEGSASYTLTVIDPNEKGSKNNPYTVAEVIGGSATGTGIYVKGFIVGEYVGKTTNPRTSGFTTDANIAIADDFTTSPTASGSIPVALPTDALKSAWGNQTNEGTTLRYEVLIKGNKDTYFSVNGIKNTSEVTAVSAPAVVSAAGYATFVAKAAVDFTSSSIKAYIAEPDGATGVTFRQVNKIPANTGVLLYKDGGATEEIPVTTESTDYLGNNVFVPGTGAAVASTNDNLHNYILYNGANGIGFYGAAGKVVAKGKAYIQIDESVWGSVKGFIALPGFDETGVSEIVNGQSLNGKWYNLSGQRVNKAQKGIFIVNGKKVVK